MKSKARFGSKQRNFDVKVFYKKVFLLFGRICNPEIMYRIINAYIRCWRIANPPEQGNNGNHG